MSLTPVEDGQREPNEEQRRKGYKLVVRSREQMQADAVGVLDWREER
jgi:hypothetical protein